MLAFRQLPSVLEEWLAVSAKVYTRTEVDYRIGCGQNASNELLVCPSQWVAKWPSS